MTKKELFTALLNLPTVQARPDFVAGLEHEPQERNAQAHGEAGRRR